MIFLRVNSHSWQHGHAFVSIATCRQYRMSNRCLFDSSLYTAVAEHNHFLFDHNKVTHAHCWKAVLGE